MELPKEYGPTPRNRTSVGESSVHEGKQKDASDLERTAEISSTVKDKVEDKNDDGENTDSESSDDEIGNDSVETTHNHRDAYDPSISGRDGLAESPKSKDAGLTPQLQHLSHQTDDQASAVSRQSDTHGIASESGQSLISEREEERGDKAVRSESNRRVSDKNTEETSLKQVSYKEDLIPRVENISQEGENEAVSSETNKSLVSDKYAEETSLKQVSTDENLISSAGNRAEELREDSETPILGKETEEIHGKETEEKQSGNVDRQQNSPPRPAQRRSVRQRKALAWFDSYHMNQMVARPYDSRLESLNVLLNSGVLGELDADCT